MWDFSSSRRFRTISQALCPAQDGFLPVHQLVSNPAEMETAERRVSGLRGVFFRWCWNSMKFPTCFACVASGSLQKGGSLGLFTAFCPAKYLQEGRGWGADVLTNSPKMPLLEVDDMLMQDHKTVFVQKSTSQVSWIHLEFGEIGHLATLTKRWGLIACSCAMNYFPSLFKQVISSQAQQNKYEHRMMWLSAEMYRVWGWL